MPIEVERKFLVTGDSWRHGVTHARHYRQGYLSQDGRVSVRVRTDGEVAHLNIKSAVVGTTRAEYEYEIPSTHAEEMLERYCTGRITKTRFWVPHERHTWEVVVFEAENAGLVVAELELTSPDEPFERPDWLGDEVTHERRYYNSELSRHPYPEWGKDG